MRLAQLCWHCLGSCELPRACFRPCPKSSAALQDAQRAHGLVRSRAGRWHLDPKRVGVLGFSAGAHLSAALSTHFEQRLYDPIDDADKVSCRPDFAVIVYPGYLALAEQNFAPNSEIHVTEKTPPSLHRSGRGRSGACRKLHRLVPRPEERQSSGGDASLCQWRARLRASAHRASHH